MTVPATCTPRTKTEIRSWYGRIYPTSCVPRFFEAAQIGHTISRVIRIPDIGMALNDCQVSIRGKTYQVLQMQEIMDSCPRCLQLSLEQPNICWAAEMEE